MGTRTHWCGLHRVRLLRGSFFVNTLFASVILWAGFTAARFITHDQFDGQPNGLTVLNISHEPVTLVVMAVIIGVWPA